MRAQKLDSFEWSHTVLDRRCLNPATAFVKAKVKKVADLAALQDMPVIAVAEIWRDTAEWAVPFHGLTEAAS